MGNKKGCLHDGVLGRPAGRDSKGYSLAGQKGFFPWPQKVLFLRGVAQNDRAQDGPRRRQKALGRVITCPGDWMALKRRPRNRALFALWHIGLICKIEAGLGLV